MPAVSRIVSISSTELRPAVLPACSAALARPSTNACWAAAVDWSTAATDRSTAVFHAFGSTGGATPGGTDSAWSRRALRSAFAWPAAKFPKDWACSGVSDDWKSPAAAWNEASAPVACARCCSSSVPAASAPPITVRSSCRASRALAPAAIAVVRPAVSAVCSRPTRARSSPSVRWTTAV